MSSLGKKICALRLARNLTLEQLAEQTDSSKGYIWELENRSTRKPSAEKLMKIAEILGTTIEYLLDESGEATKEDANDLAFIKKFKSLPADMKEKIIQITQILSDTQETALKASEEGK